MANIDVTKLEDIKRRRAERQYCEHVRFKGHHIEAVSPIKRVRWFQCLDCGDVFAPTPISD